MMGKVDCNSSLLLLWLAINPLAAAVNAALRTPLAVANGHRQSHGHLETSSDMAMLVSSIPESSEDTFFVRLNTLVMVFANEEIADPLQNKTLQLVNSLVSERDVGGERKTGLAQVTTEVHAKTTSVSVSIATPDSILLVMFTIFAPVILGWVAYLETGRPESLYVVLLPLSLCSTMIADNFVQKALAVVTDAPMVVTAVQAVAVGVIGLLWSIVQFHKQSLSLSEIKRPLMLWALVAVMFTVYQLFNHLVALLCSLSERTVFMNLCPIFSLVIETTLMPQKLQVETSWQSKTALAMMVMGALIFSAEYPDLTLVGSAVGLVMTLCVVPYRLAQRYVLSECLGLPIMLLVFYDCSFLAVPSSIIAVHDQPHFWRSLSGWISHESVPVMLVLSLFTFATNHICALALLRVSSATSFQVLQNFSNFLVVGLGVVFFRDKVLSSPLVSSGIIVCLLGGLWYAVESNKLSTVAAAAASAQKIEERLNAAVFEGQAASSIARRLADPTNLK
mmetsp:Transcript_36995/g.81262  ORF Transcript_36995/g.81262 Transcript_36995/m.81262 type:complete len:506 (-) Transcript_36995:9-1526(-)